MADYRIPQLLMHFGIINITKNNIKKMKKQLLDTDLERTVRAATINACQRIANKCNLSEAETDKLLWILSQNMLEKDFLKTPMMRVATKHY